MVFDPRPVRGLRLAQALAGRDRIATLHVTPSAHEALEAARALQPCVLVHLGGRGMTPEPPPGCRLLCLPDPPTDAIDAIDALATMLLTALQNDSPMTRPAPRVILIGASTGGIEALYHLLPQLPADCPPTLVVQHLRPGFERSLIDGLRRRSRARVAEASEGAPAACGTILIAPIDRHLHLTTRGAALDGGGATAHLSDAPPRWGHRPSVDELFFSACTLPQPPVAAVLTGMGCDGAAGLLALRQQGARTLAQDRDSSAVFGMPRAAAQAGGAEFILPLDQIAPQLLRLALADTGGHHGQE